MNKYETFRDTIAATIQKEVVSVSEDMSRTSYSWSIGKCFNECGLACKFEDTNNLPDEFKSIVRFEFNKLKESVLSRDGFSLHRSAEGYLHTRDGIELQRVDAWRKSAIPLDEQLRGARMLLSKAEKSATNDKATAESRLAAKKRANRLLKEIDHLRAESERQAILVAEVKILSEKPEELTDGVTA